ncbi:PilN domain-containing protein [Methylocella sp.]|uniref:PilN domain-containing protein n=1 Tax=Methylocella sp. TaxID=1978226 RepID=UPI0035B32617
MNAFDAVSAKASRWLDETADAILGVMRGLRPQKAARLVEEADGSFLLAAQSPAPARADLAAAGGRARFENGALVGDRAPALAAALSGARVELALRSDRFLFRPLQLPRRAADFLEGIVRSQIDRLTPWSPAEAAFGFRPERETAGERMLVTVAATSKRVLSPYVEAARGLGVETLVISAAPAAPAEGDAIRVMEQQLGGALDARGLKRILTGALVGLGLACALALVASSFVTQALQSRQEEIAGEIRSRRAALMRSDDATSAAAGALRQRKSEGAPAVLVYDELSRILPDDAYLTELRLQGDKVQLAGIASDASALIGLIERSKRFAHAVFYAPTTKSPSETRQHFFIEAHVNPGLARPSER